MRHFGKFIAIIANGILLSACSAPIKNEALPPAQGGPAVVTAATAVQPGNARSNGDLIEDSFPASSLIKRSLYFDFDSDVIHDYDRPTLQRHADFLYMNKHRTILIRGHTDEVGSAEYNLALGQRRAEAVRKALAVLGVSDSRMEAVSLGEERPIARGDSEIARAENRRVDIDYH